MKSTNCANCIYHNVQATPYGFIHKCEFSRMSAIANPNRHTCSNHVEDHTPVFRPRVKGVPNV